MPAPVFTEAERIAAAQAYIDALVSHDADAVPFAPDCTRIEVGLKTGFSGDHLRRSLNRGPQYRVIRATTTPEFTVDGETVRAQFDLVDQAVLGGRRVGAHIDETFLIPAEDGQIHHIRASIRPFLTRQDHGMANPPWPHAAPSTSRLRTRPTSSSSGCRARRPGIYKTRRAARLGDKFLQGIRGRHPDHHRPQDRRAAGESRCCSCTRATG